MTIKQKNFLFISLIGIFLFLFFIPKISLAQGTFIERIGRFAVQAILGGLLYLLFWIGYALLKIGVALFSYATIPLFNLPFTIPGQAPYGNPIILVGWRIIRDITNMGFIIGLLYIGLATALRLSNFKTQQSFAFLILIALIINFSPVICGIIVDASNLAMAFFLGGATDWSKLESIMKTELADNFFNSSEAGFTGAAVFNMLCLVAFGFVAGFILLLYAVLYLVRNIAIWVLVIFSPAAFFSYIFPQTRRLFLAWWKQLIEWAFIGAIAAFFIYLAAYCLVLTESNNVTVNPMPLEEGLKNPVTNAPYYFVSLVFLIIGYTFSKKTNAAGAQAIMGLTQAALTTVGLGTMAGGKAAATRAARMLATHFAPGARTQEEREANARRLQTANFFTKFGNAITLGLRGDASQEELEAIGAFGRFAYRRANNRISRRIRQGAMRSLRNEADEIAQIQKNYEKLSTQELAEIAKSGRYRDKTAAIKELIKRRELHDAIENYSLGRNQIAQVVDYLHRTRQYDTINDLTPYIRQQIALRAVDHQFTDAELGILHLPSNDEIRQAPNPFGEVMGRIIRNALSSKKGILALSYHDLEEIFPQDSNTFLQNLAHLTPTALQNWTTERDERLVGLLRQRIQQLGITEANLLDRNPRLAHFLRNSPGYNVFT